MGADETGSRFYECTQCWSLVREASRSDHEAVHKDQNKPRWAECGKCRATVHMTQKAQHRAWHDTIEKQIRDLATGPRPAQVETPQAKTSEEDAAHLGDPIYCNACKGYVAVGNWPSHYSTEYHKKNVSAS